MSLSDKIQATRGAEDASMDYFPSFRINDVREAVQRIKEKLRLDEDINISHPIDVIRTIIDEEFGGKLV